MSVGSVLRLFIIKYIFGDTSVSTDPHEFCN